MRVASLGECVDVNAMFMRIYRNFCAQLLALIGGQSRVRPRERDVGEGVALPLVLFLGTVEEHHLSVSSRFNQTKLKED